MENQVMKPWGTGKKIVFRLIMFFLIMCIVFFLPARTFNFWQAWVYIGTIFPCAIIVIFYFLKHDPGFMERRMKTKEQVREQKLIVRLGWFLFVPTYIIPGFDKYYGWSHIPIYLIIISDVLVLVGYSCLFGKISMVTDSGDKIPIN